ncbi:unnamed protein product [Caenorhabditis sp. 36 PRJEB53466]|nr:unnamed protein product [Caenorhabditis sp. 36 PRJEB53466]
MTGAEMAGAEMAGAEMTGAEMTGAEMTGAEMARCRNGCNRSPIFHIPIRDDSIDYEENFCDLAETMSTNQAPKQAAAAPPAPPKNGKEAAKEGSKEGAGFTEDRFKTFNITGADLLKFDLPKFIRKLLRKNGAPKAVKHEIKDVHVLLERVRDVYMADRCALIEVPHPVNICGDTHGQYTDLLRIFNACGAPTRTRYLFLGDYVDRGRHSMEVIMLLFALKLALPKKMYLLRGNHELKAINKNYGFKQEVKNVYRDLGGEHGECLYNHFNEVFTWMPLAAHVAGRILCMHGGEYGHVTSFFAFFSGISPCLTSLNAIREIPLPLETAKSNNLACDLLWADPEAKATAFAPNKIRAISNIFGPKQVDELCRKLDLDYIIRAHQVVEYGYAFFVDRRLITVFSASRYQEELHNYAAVVIIDADRELSFLQLKPEEFDQRRDELEAAGTREPEQTTANVPDPKTPEKSQSGNSKKQ